MKLSLYEGRILDWFCQVSAGDAMSDTMIVCQMSAETILGSWVCSLCSIKWPGYEVYSVSTLH